MTPSASADARQEHQHRPSSRSMEEKKKPNVYGEFFSPVGTSTQVKLGS